MTYSFSYPCSQCGELVEVEDFPGRATEPIVYCDACLCASRPYVASELDEKEKS